MSRRFGPITFCPGAPILPRPALPRALHILMLAVALAAAREVLAERPHRALAEAAVAVILLSHRNAPEPYQTVRKIAPPFLQE